MLGDRSNLLDGEAADQDHDGTADGDEDTGAVGKVFDLLRGEELFPALHHTDDHD